MKPINRILSCLLSVVFVLGVTCAAFPFYVAADLTSGDFSYTVCDGYVVIAKYLGSKSDLVIPETIEGLPVMELSEESFSDHPELESVTFPESLYQIKYAAFLGCTGLKSIWIPENLSRIGSCVFAYCSGLERIEVDPNNSVFRSVGNCLLEGGVLKYGCKNSNIPDDGSVIEIAASAFEGCIDLTEIVLPKSLTKIDEFAFYGCTGLTTVSLPKCLAGVNEWAFGNCPALADVFYGGSEQDRDQITVGYANEALLNATWHYARCAGDLNGDGALNLIDYLLLKRYFLELIDLDEETMLYADVNGDGDVDPLDYFALKRRILAAQ